VNYDTAWLLRNKILKAMSDRDDAYVLQAKIQMDDAYLGGECSVGKAGRASENKIPVVAAVSLNEAGHPIYARISAVSGFSSETIADKAKRQLMRSSHVLSDGLACFLAVSTANCQHTAVGTGGKHPNVLPQFHWINTLLDNVKTSFSGTFHAFNCDKYARRYLGGNCLRFNRRFSMSTMTARIASAVCCCRPFTEKDLGLVEPYG
jgi:hypothetical protein